MSDSNPRPIERGDEASVHALIALCYREYGLMLNLDDECEQHLHDPGAYFRAHGGEFWVVCDEAGAVRATVALTLHDAKESAPVAELKSMYVHPEWRRRGWGRRLAQLVMDEARARGCAEMELWSDTRFEAAHAMYESLGFERFGRRDIVDSNNSAEYGFRRRL